MCISFFFFNDTATTEIYTLSLHDALPIFLLEPSGDRALGDALAQGGHGDGGRHRGGAPSGAVGGGGGAVGQPCTCSGLPASARWASPRASLCVGCGWMRAATSSASASQL